MIAIVRRPSERKFRHIAGSNDKPSGLVRNVHQYLGPLSRLPIFIGHVLYFRIVSNILKMLQYSLFNRNFFQCRSEFLCQFDSIIIGSVCRTKTWHRHTHDSFTVKVQLIECTDRDKQRKGRVQSSGKPDHSALTSRMAQTFGKSSRLNI